MVANIGDISLKAYKVQDIYGPNTEENDYVVRYYIADLITFCYNDMTFGNKTIGTYPLNVYIKEYD